MTQGDMKSYKKITLNLPSFIFILVLILLTGMSLALSINSLVEKKEFDLHISLMALSFGGLAFVIIRGNIRMNSEDPHENTKNTPPTNSQKKIALIYLSLTVILFVFVIARAYFSQ